MTKIKDIQNQTDKREIRINKVGVKGLKYPIILEDRENGKQNSIAKVNMYVELPHQYRGTHMSRFVEILNHYHKETIVENLESLLFEMKKKLNANVAYIELEFLYFIKKKAPVSKEESLMSYKCKFDAHFGNEYIFEMSVTVPVITLCPCSKEISEFGAHNQRTYVTARISYKDFVWLEELIKIIEKSGSSELYSLLKRSDEKYVTEKSYNNPKFVEDLVREVAERLKSDPRITSYKIEAESIESIHNHNAYAMVEGKKLTTKTQRHKE
ncbi:MAG: GTP cyclohydrolase I FolE2 [Candidatus Cloacimonetes bacterium]|nr:GTP cyclohydrolase I FolE2 [Candidatus Cloacimonadota bacterium]